MSYLYIGKTMPRIDAWDKVTGKARYTDDVAHDDTLHAAILTSTRAHARIHSIETQEARQMPGVRAVVTGADFPKLTGSPLEDWPLLAIDVVRYIGEPIVLIVADEPHQSMTALQAVHVIYEDLPVIQSPRHAANPQSPLIHPALASYRIVDSASPVPGTNIANHAKIRKGDITRAWETCDVVIETKVSFPQSHHAAMETHVATAEVFVDGRVDIMTASQAPYALPDMIEQVFGYEKGRVTVHTPLVGGGFGGKAPAYWELLAVLASIATNGRKVTLCATREQAMTTLPGHIGLEAIVRLGAKGNGTLVAAQFTFWFDGGAYSNRGLIVTQAAAADCTGPYRVPNVWCDSYCMYTNHPPTTAYRGFGHPEATFAMERALDTLARKLGVDDFALRRTNAIVPGDTTPTQAVLTRSNVGNVPGCLARLQALMTSSSDSSTPSNSSGPPSSSDSSTPSNSSGPPSSSWPDNAGLIRASGICCIWKNSSTPPNASSSAIVKVERDGTVTLVSGVVEIGQGTKSALTQMVAEVFRIPPGRVRVVLPVNTATTPEHWKTVASRSSLLAGNATIRAARDAVRQLRQTAAAVFGVTADEVHIEGGFAKVQARIDSRFAKAAAHRIPISKLSHGYSFPDGRTVGQPVIGVGSYVIEDVVPLDKETGRGVPGPEWAVGAQGVEILFDPVHFTYKVVRAVSVIDCGQVIHPALARGQVIGAMNMGLSLGSREGYVYSVDGGVTNFQFRTYPIHRYGDQPQYIVEFLETPDEDAPFGLRGLGEHGLIGMPAALANALSKAMGRPVNQMPMTSETLWRITQGLEPSPAVHTTPGASDQ